jgi:hypothetical protein
MAGSRTSRTSRFLSPLFACAALGALMPGAPAFAADEIQGGAHA